MVDSLQSNGARRERNFRAFASAILGLLAAASLPAAVALAELANEIELLDAAFAVPLTLALAVVTLVLARRARQRAERTLGRVGGRRTAAVGKWLGMLGVGVGSWGAIAVATYAALERMSG